MTLPRDHQEKEENSSANQTQVLTLLEKKNFYKVV